MIILSIIREILNYFPQVFAYQLLFFPRKAFKKLTITNDYFTFACGDIWIIKWKFILTKKILHNNNDV